MNSNLVLGIDVGTTTGYALWREGSGLVESGNILSEDLDESILAQNEWDLQAVVIEYPVESPTLPKGARQAARTIRNLFPDAIEVYPGVWKTSGVVTLFPFPSNKFPDSTPHQKDAYWIVKYIQRLWASAQKELV